MSWPTRVGGVLAAFLLTTVEAHGQTSASPQRLLDDVHYLASDSLAGRWLGSPGADSAAAYLARRFEAVGLRTAGGDWFQPFTVAPDAPAAAHAPLGGASGRNVIGVLEGRDPALRREVVVVGAHYDHLGTSGFDVLDPDSAHQIHNGADDNASGAAALVGIAASLASHPPARTVVFVAFSGEEEGLLGSAYYVQHPSYPVEQTTAMINLDMVGRLRNDRLLIFGTETAAEFSPLIDSLNEAARFEIHRRGDGYGPSDQTSFYAAGVPVLFLFTDLHEDYHRSTDDWEKINPEGLARVVRFAARLVENLGNRPTRPTYVPLPPPRSAPGGAPVTGATAYLGTVPDMTENPGGVRLTAIRPGSPAEAAGLRPGDIITGIGGQAIPDLQAMSDVLRSHQPGDTVEIIALRDGETTRLQAILGRRGN
jgi:hypothetical protein